MKREHASLIVQYGGFGEESFDIHEDYSGRGMFGKTTTGVVTSYRGFLSASVRAVQGEMCAHGDTEEVEEFVNDVGKVQIDSMGKDRLIFY